MNHDRSRHSNDVPLSVEAHEAERRRRFKDTALAIYDIVTNRRYRDGAHTSLESYFREVWRMSRAQVYRFMDVAHVYLVGRLFNSNKLMTIIQLYKHSFQSPIYCLFLSKALDGFETLPYREKICLTLKALGKNKEDIRTLWERTVRLSGNDTERAVSSVAQRAWNELLREGRVTGAPPPDQGTQVRDEALMEYYQSVNTQHSADGSRISDGISPVLAPPLSNGMFELVLNAESDR